MKVSIKATNLKLTLELRKAIDEKIATLDRFIPTIKTPLEADVEVALETRHHQKGAIYYAEVNIKVLGEVIRAEAREENIFRAISVVREELQGLLKKYKKKQIAKREKALRALKEKSDALAS